jgi:hypothetical protein
VTRIAPGTYLAQLVGLASDPSDEIERSLRHKGSWSRWSEWRIGTVTEERIDRVPDGYAVSSACDLHFTAQITNLPDALVAREIFALLHADLFYSFGWPSWAGYMRMNAEDPVRAPYSADAKPYLVQLYANALDGYERRFGDIGRAIEQDGVWAERGKEIRSSTGYPEIPPETGEAALEEPWFEGRVRQAPVEVRWKSPTCERTALFVGLLDRLLLDLIHAGVWPGPREESAG